MAEFILKDWYGKDCRFNHDTIYAQDANGNLVPFTQGEKPVFEALEVTENGTYIPSEGVDGFNSVSVDVPIPEVVLQDKTITENGTFTADEGFDGLGSITVEVAGAGGGSLPVGAYWKQDDISLPIEGSPRMFMLNGFLYVLARSNQSDQTTGRIYKLVNNAWVQIGGTFSAKSGYYYAYPIEYNGKAHFIGGLSLHYTYDEENGFQELASLPSGSYRYAIRFIQEGKLKVYNYSDGKVYVWNEASDTWTAEATLGTNGSYLVFANIDGVIYVIYNEGIYIYDGGLTFVRNVIVQSKSIYGYLTPPIALGKCIYGYTSDYIMTKIDVETGVQTDLGRLPEVYSNNSKSMRLFQADCVRFTSGSETDKNKVNLIMHEVTE